MNATAKPCRWGIWATGGIAAKFAADLGAVSGAAKHSVLSRSLKKAADFAGQHHFLNAYEDIDAFLADPDLDVIYIASPHVLHFAQALKAIEAGKSILIEKAIAMSTEEAKRINQAAKAAKVFTMEALWTRFLPTVQRAKAILDAETIGTVTHIDASLHFHRPFDAGHRLFDPALGGGVLHDLGVYPISLARFFAGPLTLESSEIRLAPTGVDQSANMTLKAERASVSISVGFEDTFAGEGENTFVVHGTQGTLRIDRHFLGADSITLWDKPMKSVPTSLGLKGKISKHIAFDGRKTETFPRRTHGLNYEAEAVQLALAQGWQSHPAMPVSESIEVLAIIEQALSQKPVS